MYRENNKENYEAFLERELRDTINSMDLQHNNISNEPAYLRDVFLYSEKEYVLYLLQDEELKDFIVDINRCHNADALLHIAQDLVDKVENNLIPYEKMEEVEKKLIILLSAVRDKVLEKVKEKDYEAANEYGRSR
jgi:hypothetical protein